MSPRISSSPIVHSVHFYDFDEALIQRLKSIVSAAIGAGNSIIIVSTDEHRKQLIQALESYGVDPRGVEKDGRLLLFDVREMLAKFMVDGRPVRDLFLASVGKVILSAKERAWNAHRGLTVFGEMVSVLWEDGNRAAALSLESLWNDLLNDRAFHLHCAYPRHLLNGDSNGIRAICDGHSHVIGQAA